MLRLNVAGRPAGRRVTPLVIATIAACLAACDAARIEGTAPPPATPQTSVSTPIGDPVAEALARGRPTVLELGSNACAACRDVREELEKLRRSHGGRVEIVEIDLIRQREYIARFKVQLMPTQVFYDAHGRELGRNVGRIDAPAMLARLGVAAP